MSEDKDLELDDTQAEDAEVITGDEEELPDYDTLLAQKKELESKYKKVDGARLHYKQKYEKLATEKPQANQEKPIQSNGDYERLSLEVKGYSEEEIDFIMKYGGLNSIKDPIIQAGIAKYREDKKLSEATSIKGSGSEGSKYISLEKFASLSSEEQEKAIRAGKVKE